MYVYQEFPKYKYHAEKESVVVHSKEHEEALGSDWADSPAHVAKSCAKDCEVPCEVVEPLKELKKSKRAKS